MINLKKILRVGLKNRLFLTINSLGRKKQCYICKKTFLKFKPYKNGVYSPFIKELEVIGSDPLNFGCYYCGAHDRERHLFMYFDKLKFWKLFKGKNVLHFAPEKHLRIKLKDLVKANYIQADLNPQNNEIYKIDITEISFPDMTFDFVICNHVLEHIPNDLKALKEIYRVLRTRGKAILQTPFSKMIQNSFEDPRINSDELRERFYGEIDHYRIYGIDFFQKLKSVGFKLNIIKNDELFSNEECYKFGVNPKEDLIMVVR